MSACEEECENSILWFLEYKKKVPIDCVNSAYQPEFSKIATPFPFNKKGMSRPANQSLRTDQARQFAAHFLDAHCCDSNAVFEDAGQSRDHTCNMSGVVENFSCN